VIRSIVLEDMDTAQAVAEASRLLEESPADAESDVARLINASDQDAHAVRRCADPATLVAAHLVHRTDGRSAGNTITWRFTELIGAAVAERGADAAALVAAVLPRTAHHLIARLAHAEVLGAWDAIRNADAAAFRATSRAWTTADGRARVLADGDTEAWAIESAGAGIAVIAWDVNTDESVWARYVGEPAAQPSRLGVAELIGADAAERGADAAALVAAEFPWAANRLVTRLTDAQILRTRHIRWDAYTSALGTTGRALNAENRRARVDIDRHTDSGAVRAAGGGIATVARIVNTDESVWARYAGDPAAHSSRLGVADDRGAPSTQRRADSTAWIAAILACSAPIASARFARRWLRRTELARAALP
jgi:hypothetical protein